MEIYYFIFFFAVAYFMLKVFKKIIYLITMNLQLQQIKFEKYGNEPNNENEDTKPEKFNNVLKQKKSRLDKIIACKNS